MGREDEEEEKNQEDKTTTERKPEEKTTGIFAIADWLLFWQPNSPGSRD